MKYYSVLDVTPNSDEWIPAYLPIANKLVARHGGRYLARTTQHEQIEGEEKKAGLRIILEWPTKESAIKFMNDPEYAPHFEARTKGSQSHHYLIEANDEFI
ncbi:MAG: DUF1330 domain-containing protein [Bacteroidota bacterium]